MEGESLLRRIPIASDTLTFVEQLIRSAFIDRLTGLLNKAALEKLNDQHGHAAGDLALTLAGKAIATLAADHSAEAFRVGGDEFLILLGEDRLVALVAEAHSRLKRFEFLFADKPASFSATIGFCAAVRDATLDALIHRADTACRVAKAMGDVAPIQWVEGLNAEAPDDPRRKCTICMATTQVLVAPSSKHEGCLSRCANCGAEFPAENQ